jgi:hydroxyethylthiazole kinase-like uncharacterized protein yjeF
VRSKCDDLIELLTPVEMGEADRLTIAGGKPGFTLMLNAGAQVAAAAAQMARELGRREIAVFCGPGNNGGDGYVAAQMLHEQGFEVRVGALGNPAALKGDAALAFAQWSGPTPPLSSLEPGAGVVIDAIFGAGLSRPLDGEALVVARKINASGAAVLAIDVPSGLDGANGAVGSECVQARQTVTFFRLKPGHLLMPGRLACGEVRLVQIGIEADVLASIGPRQFLNAPGLWRSHWPQPSIAGHKYGRGHLVVLSGPMHQTGAARMAARAGLRVGAGLATLASPGDALAVNAAHLTAIMLRQVDDATGLAELLGDRRFNACVLGPGAGVGDATRAKVRAALGAAKSGEGRRFGLILDADALTSFAPDWQVLAGLIHDSGADVVLTPHEGEFSRLFNGLCNKVDVKIQPGTSSSGDKSIISNQHIDFEYRVDRARAAACATGALLVLKGPDTIVAAPDGRICIARNAPPYLATAGAGDVLAGLIGGLLAQSMPAFEACACAVWLHGEAARRFGPGLIAEDLPESLPQALRDLVAQT